MLNTTLDNRYLIEAELGRGGMGIVYRARDTLLERLVAVKLLSSSALGATGQARLLHEARAAASLNHPNIVAVYDVGTAALPDQPGSASYIVMELVDGRSLEGYRAKSVEQLSELAAQICLALQEAHDKGIIHRDLKPENIILSGSETIKLMDFGLARSSGRTRITEEGTVVGTLAYLAPEIILGQPASVQSDLYALGVMIYDWLSDRPPFEGEGPTAILSQHLYAPVVPPSSHNQAVSPELDRLVLQLLAKQPERRPASAEEVRLALEQAMATPPGIEPKVMGAQLSRLVRGRMVGRQDEFDQAVQLWREAAAGKGKLLFISGEPGIGKTRLVRELIAYVEFTGGNVLEGQCYEADVAPYGPFANMIRSSLGEGAGADLPELVLADLLTMTPDLGTSYPGVPLIEALEPEADRRRLSESVASWLESRTVDSALLIVIDDIHWADSGSLALLRHLTRRLRRQPLMIVASSRNLELGESKLLQELLSVLNRERLAERIELTRLSRDRTDELLTTILGEGITSELLEGIYQETEGNPFFVEEVCKALVDNGKLYFEGGRWHRLDTGKLEIPQSVLVAIQSRLSRMEKADLRLLQTGALLGREFEYGMLAAVSGMDEDRLIDALEAAESAQIIDEVRDIGYSSEPRFSFSHELIRATLLSDLSTLRRRRLQYDVALALDEAYPDRRDELAPKLGRYFAEAGDGERAVPLLLLAGDQARMLYAYEEATVNYRLAISFLTESGDLDQAARTLMKQGQTHHNALEFEKSRRAYEEGFALWQRAGPAAPAELPPAPHPFRLMDFEPESLDPALGSGQIVSNMFSGLTKLSPEMVVLPDVAQSWDVLEGGRKYIFHLREDVYWSDGHRVTAADFECAWKRLLDPSIGAVLPSLLFDIKNAQPFHRGELVDPDLVAVRPLDEFTLEVELEKPTGYFLEILANSMTSPVPRHAVMKWSGGWAHPDKIMTNGPFLLKTWEPDLERPRAIFESNPNYHGLSGGNVEQIQVYFYPEYSGQAPIQSSTEIRTERWQLYKEGSLDYVSLQGQDPLEFAHSRHRHAGELLSRPLFSIARLVFNTRQPPFDDPRVRRAFALATDREWWANTALDGLHFPATGGIVPPGMPGHVAGLALPYDPEQARRLLAEAGYPGGRGLSELSLMAPYWAEWSVRQEEYLGSVWLEILGVHVSFDWAAGQRYRDGIREGKHNMYLAGWIADYPDPDNFLRVAIGQSRLGWRNHHYDELIDRARWQTNQTQRMELYELAENILLEEVPVLPVFYRRDLGLLKPWVRRALYNPMTEGWFWEEIVIAPH